MLSTPLTRVVPLLLGVLLALVTAAAPARADVVLLTNGDLVLGEVDAAQFSVLTDAGAVQVAPGDLRDATLATISGDVLRYRNGTALTGIVDQPSYAVRLPSGQTLVIERERVAVISFRSR
jgi:hypothetical protein